MPQILLLVLLCLLAGCTESGKHDPKAVAVLDNMGEYIGGLHSASFSVETSFDATVPDLGTLQRNRTSDVYLVGPNKMHVYVQGDRGRSGVWYNGSTAWFYSFDKRIYDKVAAPPTIIAAIDSMHHAYGVEFPGADFLYPTFTIDLLENNPTVQYVGTTIIGGIPCDHIVARNGESSKEIWVASSGPAIPVRLMIATKQGERFESTIRNWVSNPQLDSSMFEFIAPEDARKSHLTTVFDN